MGLLEEQTRRRVAEEVVFPSYESGSIAREGDTIYQTQEKKNLGSSDFSMMSSVDGDKANIALLLFLYTLQGIPLGLASALPIILQNKGVNYKDQVSCQIVICHLSFLILFTIYKLGLQFLLCSTMLF